MELAGATRLRVGPDPLTPVERRMFAVGWMVVAASRLLLPARSPWDWDEMLFCLALRDYDVTAHHPHPPGFPLFVATAKVLTLLGASDFRALQTVTLIGSVLLFPAIFTFAREAGVPFSTAYTAALILVFLPNVWFFGETAFSDVPSLAVALFACAMLLRGSRSSHAYLVGATLLGVAAGFRPQNLLLGLLPASFTAVSLLRMRRFRPVGAAFVVIVVIVVVAYGGAVWATGSWGGYRQSVTAHERYIRTVDSFTSATRPELRRVADDFFFRPFRAPTINVVVAVLTAVSLVVSMLRRRRPILIVVATFAPFALFAWLILDYLSASRFSIGYAPLSAILTADGIAILSAAVPSSRVRIFLTSAGGAILVAALAMWSFPAVRFAAAQLSPPVQAMSWIRDHLDPKVSTIYVASLGPHAGYYLHDYHVVPVRMDMRIYPSPHGWFLKEGPADRPGTRTFAWPRDRLAKIARRRYFEVSVVPIR